MSTFWKVAPWISKLILLPPTAIFIMIAVQHLAKPAAMAAAEGFAFTSPVGPTVKKLPSKFLFHLLANGWQAFSQKIQPGGNRRRGLAFGSRKHKVNNG